MASWIATQFNGTATDLQRSSLYYLAVILLVISLLTNRGPADRQPDPRADGGRA